MKRFLLLIALSCAACETRRSPQPATNILDTVTSHAQVAPGYNNFRAFTDSLLHRDDVNFTGEKIEVTGWAWSEEEGIHLLEPAAMDVDHVRFPLRNMDIVNGDTERAYQPYVVDSAVVFRMGGRRYAYFSASIYNCNAGCRAAFHFIADFAAHKLHWFEVRDDFEVAYVGDIDNDNRPDFILPYYECLRPDTYCDTAQAVTLIAYSLNAKGNYTPMLNDYKRQRIITGILNTHGSPGNFRVVQDMWER